MKRNWRRLLTTLALGSCLAMLVPSCVIRARAQPVYVVDEAPPPPRYETQAPRAGYVWIRGHWEWRSGRWDWKRGHWVRERSGYGWTAGHWERRGNRYHWVEGRWTVGATATPAPNVRDHRTPPPQPQPDPNIRDHRTPAPAAYPTAAPPDPRYETPAGRAGYVWVRGHYEWRGGAYVWKRGHWKRERAGYAWEPGHWELRGDRYVWIPGKWVQGAPAPKVRDHRTKEAPPPGRKNETVPARRGR